MLWIFHPLYSKRHLKRPSAIEPQIGHKKSERKLGRNLTKGMLGDTCTAMCHGSQHVDDLAKNPNSFYLYFYLFF